MAQEGDPEPAAFGSLKMTLTPSNAKWTVDALTPTADTPQYESGDTVHGLAVGPHTVQFVPVSGYQTPAPVTVTVIPYADQNDQNSASTPPQTKTYLAGSGAAPVAPGANAIKVAGTFRLRRVSDIAALNP